MLNKVQFIGHLGKDPETRYMANGSAVCSFSVASSEKWKDKNGEQQESTEWLRVTAFEKLAEICGQYLKKGSLVYVEGSLKTRKYTDKDGIERQATECRLSSMKMLGGQPEKPAPRSAPPARPPAKKADTTAFDDMDSDIPF